ncbi:autotransporter-associated beta strand repeat-containing protein, partial [Alcaligenaceae bacterium Me47]
DIGDFGPGRYRIFDYTGARYGTGLTLGTVPTGADKAAMAIQTDTDHQVNLFYAGQVAFNNWDGGNAADHGNNKVDGGDGIWDANNDNWTTLNGAINGAWNDSDYAFFAGKPGIVGIDDSAGALTAQGLIFSVDGYRIKDGYLTLAGSQAPTVRVGDATPEGASTTARVASELRGTQGLTKIDYGTLILTGDNHYTGGTTVREGILQLGDGGNSGSIEGDVVLVRTAYDYGTLAFNRLDAVSFAGAISGEGVVLQRGEGTTTFLGNNSYSGGLTI